jgi:hypothetical protein
MLIRIKGILNHRAWESWWFVAGLGARVLAGCEGCEGGVVAGVVMEVKQFPRWQYVLYFTWEDLSLVQNPILACPRKTKAILLGVMTILKVSLWFLLFDNTLGYTLDPVGIELR